MEITNIDQLDLSKQYSYADYLIWKIEERLELIKGWIFKMAAPSRAHQTIAGRLYLRMGIHFEGHPCHLYFAPFDVRLTRKGAENQAVTTVVQPDLCVICDNEKLDKQGCVGAPDLVVEILSPGNSKKEMRQKFEVYEENGVREYWIIDTTEKFVFIYVLNENGKFYGLKPLTEDELLVSTIFPELQFELLPIFKDLD